MSAGKLTVSLVSPKTLKPMEYPGSVADYATHWATGYARAYGEVAVRADLSEAEELLALAFAPHVLATPEAEIHARTGIGRTLFIRIAVTMKELAFTRLVMGMARSEGVLTHFCGRAIACEGGGGFPDLVLAGHRLTLFAELKSITGRRSDSQERWASQLGDRCVLWTPLDLLHIRDDLQDL